MRGPASSMTSAFPSDLKPNTVTGKAGGRSRRHRQQFIPDRLRQDRSGHDRHRRGRPGRGGRGLHRLRPRCAGRGDPQGGDGARQEPPRDRAEAPRDLPRAQERDGVRDRREGTARARSATATRCGRRPPRWARRSIRPTRCTRRGGAARRRSPRWLRRRPAAARQARPRLRPRSGSSRRPAARITARARLRPASTSTSDAEARHLGDGSAGGAALGGCDLDLAAVRGGRRMPTHAREGREVLVRLRPVRPRFPPARPPSPRRRGGRRCPKHGLADLSLDCRPRRRAARAARRVGTKLELAKAYLEIGDKDGAREILQEVAKEGSAAQKDEAQKLIASL